MDSLTTMQLLNKNDKIIHGIITSLINQKQYTIKVIDKLWNTAGVDDRFQYFILPLLHHATILLPLLNEVYQLYPVVWNEPSITLALTLLIAAIVWDHSLDASIAVMWMIEKKMTTTDKVNELIREETEK